MSSPDVFGALPALPRRRRPDSSGLRFCNVPLASLRCKTLVTAASSVGLDGMAAVRRPGQRSRAGGDATGMLRLSVSESDPRRDGDCFLYSVFLYSVGTVEYRECLRKRNNAARWRRPAGGSVPATSGMEWESKRRIPYIGWNETVRNCCFRSSARPGCASAKVPPKSQML